MSGTWNGLTEEERDFLRNHDGGLWGILSGIGTDEPRGAVGKAHAAATALVDQLAERYPNRTERLLVLSAILTAAQTARYELLTELLEGSFHWSYNEEREGEPTGNGGRYSGWGGVAFQPHDIRALADLAGMSTQAMRARYKKAQVASLHRAMEAAGHEVEP